MKKTQSSMLGRQDSASSGSDAKSLSRQASQTDSQKIAAVADAAEHDGDPHVSGDGKIKFKKAKKLTKKASTMYSKALKDTQKSRFEEWTKMEMVELLISEGVELRNESNIERVSLKELCEALYFEREMPPKPKLPSIFDIIRMNSAARRVQNMWVIKMCEKRYQEENAKSEAYIQSLQLEEEGSDELGMGAAELAYMTAPRQMIVGDKTMTESRRHDENEGTEGDTLLNTTTAPGSGDPNKLSKPTIKKRKGVNILDTPWEAPDLDKAKRFSDYVQPRKGGKGGSKFDFYKTTTGRHCCLGNLGEQLDLWEEGQISEFGIYGSGVTNYFKFIKWCFWLFFILSIIAIPMIVLNTTGPNNENDRGLQSLAKTSAGNLISPYANLTVELNIPGCNSYGVYSVDCSLTKSTLAMFYSSLDIAIVIISFLAFLWLRVFEVVEERTLEKNTVNASMFTVTVSHLPSECTEDDIISHFHKLAPTHKIANVSMAYDNAKEIEECTKRGDIIRAKVRAVHEHRHYCTKLKEKLSEEAANEKIAKEREKFYLKMAKLSEDLKAKEDLLAKYAEMPVNPIFAFVTFDRANGRETILEIFNGHSYIYNYIYNQKLKLKNKWLKVQPSPEPSTILWENLAYNKWDCYRRRAITSIIALLFILISLAMIFSAKYLEQINKNENAADLCPSNFNTYTQEEKQEYIVQNPDQLSCYCDELSTIEQSNDEYCKEYLENTIKAEVLTYFASFSVLMVNVAIEKLLKLLSSYEKHNNEDERGLSTFLRLFILKYINTTLVFFINNNNDILSNIFGVQTDSTTEFTADWFNTIGVTVLLVQIGDIVTCHGDKLYKWFIYHHKKRVSQLNTTTTSGATTSITGISTALTQDDLNQVQVGPEFEFAFEYAQLLSTFFCCFTFSTGLPLLYIISMVNFYVYYFTEKYLFIHLYRIPPHFGNNVGKRATAMLPYAFVLHLVMSIWMLSNKEIFKNEHKNENDTSNVNTGNSDLEYRATGEATLPLFIFLLIIVAIRLVTHFYKATSKTFTMLIEKLCGTRCLTNTKANRKKAASAMAVVTYTRAVQRNLIKGLATYNILQNPIYKESFAITWKFAMTNKDVRSVRNNRARAVTAQDETDADKVEHMQRNFKTIRQSAAKKQASNRGFHESFYNSPATGAGIGGDAIEGTAAARRSVDGGDVQMTALPANLRPPAISTTRERGKSSPRGGSVHGTPLQHQSLHRSSPRAPANTPQSGYVGAVAVDLNDPVLLEQQRQIYAQYQQAQSVHSTPSSRQRGGRAVDVSPLGQQRSSHHAGNTTAFAANYAHSANSSVSTHSSHRQSTGSHRSSHSRGGTGQQPAPPSAAVYGQQMYRAAGPIDYPPTTITQPVVVNNYARINNRHQQQHMGSSSGSSRSTPRSSGGYEVVSTNNRRSNHSPRIDEDGFENADHLLYE